MKKLDIEKVEKFKDVYNAWYLFIPRLVLWIGLTFVGPILAILTKFEAFTKVENEIKFNGWAIVISLIVAIGIFYILKYVVSAMTFNYIAQLISGFINLILWLILGLLLVNAITNYSEQLKYVLIVSIITCSLGVMVNPLPRWSYHRKNKDLAASIGKELAKRGK